MFGLSSLRALASASPPDPLWVPGLYDDGDYDDVVVASLALDGLGTDPAPSLEGPVRLVGFMVVPAPEDRSPAPRATADSRAPPAF